MNILDQLRQHFLAALADLAGGGLDQQQLTELVEMVRPSQDAKFGDYQANCAMPLAKRLGKPPREIAADLVGRLSARPDMAALCEPPQIAGPGFINLRLRTDWLANQLSSAAADERLGVAPVEKPRTIIIDYSAPNVAKPMHVGHIRSTVIGDALYRTLKFLGHHTISDNHIGDWGTQFGMIIYGYKQGLVDADAYRAKPSVELGRLYRQVSELAKQPEVNLQVLEETAKLHRGDPENLALWKEFLPACEADIEHIYKRVGVSFDETLGESFYHDRLPGVVEKLLRHKIARPSQGAIGVFLGDDPDTPPFLIQKQDGAFLYATTDLATIEYRLEHWDPDAMLYVVDHRQSLHFKQLFETARLWLDLDGIELAHISFGTVLGEDNKPFKARSGETVGLEGLLDEATRQALVIVSTNDDEKPTGPELSLAERQRVAEVVGIGGIKYADLSQNRTSDYVFSYEKMLAKNGNTATYMQYAYARVRSIFAKGQLDESTASGAIGSLSLEHPAERALGLELFRFSEALEAVVADYRPNRLTDYLFSLANCYSTFYEKCSVLKADTPEQRQNRLALCDLTARTLRQGLALLGIDVVDKM